VGKTFIRYSSVLEQHIDYVQFYYNSWDALTNLPPSTWSMVAQMPGVDRALGGLTPLEAIEAPLDKIVDYELYSRAL
jgi:hypothetical protein